MKTSLLFTESAQKQQVILTHDKDVKISKEVHEDTPYIVIRFPNGKVNMNDFNLRSDRWLSSGFKMHLSEKETELFFFDELTFAWTLPAFKNVGLFKVTQRHIPDQEEYFAYYIDAKGIKQWSYNAIFMSVQWLLEQRKKRKNQKERN